MILKLRASRATNQLVIEPATTKNILTIHPSMVFLPLADKLWTITHSKKSKVDPLRCKSVGALGCNRYILSIDKNTIYGLYFFDPKRGEGEFPPRYISGAPIDLGNVVNETAILDELLGKPVNVFRREYPKLDEISIYHSSATTMEADLIDKTNQNLSPNNKQDKHKQRRSRKTDNKINREDVQAYPIWTGNLDTTAFIYYQGRGQSQVEAFRYVGNHRIGTSTGEILDSKKNRILTIPRERLWVYPEIEEINRHEKYGWWGRLKNWFNGVVVTRPQPDDLLDYEPLYPQDESGSVDRFSISNSKRSLGQSTDIKDHAKKYISLKQHRQEIDNIILYGVSRGGATTFSALAENKYQNIKLCVLEGPPGSISAVLKSYFSRFLGKILYNKVITSLFVGKYHKTEKAQQAMGHVTDFPNDVPLVVISSQKDKMVPHKSSFKLALSVAAKRIAAERCGEQVAPVYFLQLDAPGHTSYALLDASQDAVRYQNFMHAVYKKHGLPYVSEYAALGDQELTTAELTRGALKNQVELQAEFKSNKPARKTIRTKALDNIRSELRTLNPAEHERAIKLCSAMPLYSKHRNRFTLFGKTDTQSKLEALLENPSTLSSQVTSMP